MFGSKTLYIGLTQTSIAPDLMVIKVCVPSYYILAWEKGMGQRATLPIKRVSIVMQQTSKGDPDVAFRKIAFTVSNLPIET